MISHLLAILLTFQEVIETPETYANQHVEVRGYLYRDPKGQVILSDTPNMRSCCFGKAEIRQISLAGEFPEELPNQVASVEGELKVAGKPYLENAKITSSSHSYGLWIMMGVPLAILAFLFLRKRR
jgi:cytochrome oxidase assembly protein ShyY1